MSKEAVSEITGFNEGNARVVAQILDNVFYAVWKEKKPITPELVRQAAHQTRL